MRWQLFPSIAGPSSPADCPCRPDSPAIVATRMPAASPYLPYPEGHRHRPLRYVAHRLSNRRRRRGAGDNRGTIAHPRERVWGAGMGVIAARERRARRPHVVLGVAWRWGGGRKRVSHIGVATQASREGSTVARVQ